VTDDHKHWKRASITGKLKVKIFGANELGPAHKKLDARCVIKVDAKEKAKTNFKPKTNKPVWNEDFEFSLDGAGEMEFHLFDKNELYSVHFFDMNKLLNQQTFTEEIEYEMEPRGLLHINLHFGKWEKRKGEKAETSIHQPLLFSSFFFFFLL